MEDATDEAVKARPSDDVSTDGLPVVLFRPSARHICVAYFLVHSNALLPRNTRMQNVCSVGIHVQTQFLLALLVQGIFLT